MPLIRKRETEGIVTETVSSRQNSLVIKVQLENDSKIKYISQ